MNDITQSLAALIGKVAESGGETTKENIINRALIDALMATLLNRGALSRSDFEMFYRIGENFEDREIHDRIVSRLDAIKKYAKI